MTTDSEHFPESDQIPEEKPTSPLTNKEQIPVDLKNYNALPAPDHAVPSTNEYTPLETPVEGPRSLSEEQEHVWGQNYASPSYYHPAQTDNSTQFYQPQPGPNPPLYQYPNQPIQPTGMLRPPVKKRSGMLWLLLLSALVIFSVGTFAGTQLARQNTNPNVPSLQTGNTGAQTTVPALSNGNEQEVRTAVISKVRPSVVQINVKMNNNKSALGSGVIIDQRGYIVTNNHVVESAVSLEVVFSDGTKVAAQLVGTDSADDLAVIKVDPPANMTVATLGDSSKLVVGQEVLAIGNPLGITQTVTQGIVSALGRTVSESNATIPNAIQTDAPINPGNSGGALVDLSGNVVGIPTLTAIDPQFNTPATGVGFAIPSSRVTFITTQIIQNGKVTHTGRAALNISAIGIDEQTAESNNLPVKSGALIHEVSQGGAADKAGLRANDIIVQIDDKVVDGQGALADVLATKNPGDTVAIKIYRGTQVMTVNVTLGELSAG